MKIATWGLGVAVALGAVTAHAGQTIAREAEHDADIDGAAKDEEPIGEVSLAATPAGSACRVTCATGYAAACLQVQRVCACRP